MINRHDISFDSIHRNAIFLHTIVDVPHRTVATVSIVFNFSLRKAMITGLLEIF